MKQLKAVLALAGCAAAASCGTNFGDAAFDVAYVAAQASEVRDCHDTYRRTGDAFRLQDCEADVRGR